MIRRGEGRTESKEFRGHGWTCEAATLPLTIVKMRSGKDGLIRAPEAAP